MLIPKGSGNYGKLKIKGKFAYAGAITKRITPEKLKTNREANCPPKKMVRTHIE